MRSGQLRHRIQIMEPVEIQNSYGEPETRWQLSETVWGSVSPLKGREYLMAQQLKAENPVRVCIRYKSGITAKYKLIFDGEDYLIHSVINPDERNREIELMCVKYAD